MTEKLEMEAVIEAILFVSQEPVPREKILSVFREREQVDATEALDAVVERYQSITGRGMVIDEVAGGLRLVTRPDLHGYLRRFFEVTGTNKLSMAALETLAIIAYRQPMTAPEVQELRNVNPSGVLKKLLERRLIRIAGRKEVVGKPFLYATSREFLMHFGLKNLKELPPLEQFEELFGGEEALEGPSPPDAEEQVGQEAAEIEEAEKEAEAEAEQEEIEAERLEAEEAPESPVDEEAADEEAADEEVSDEEAADEEAAAEDEKAADEEPAVDEEAVEDESVVDEKPADEEAAEVEE